MKGHKTMNRCILRKIFSATLALFMIINSISSFVMAQESETEYFYASASMTANGIVVNFTEKPFGIDFTSSKAYSTVDGSYLTLGIPEYSGKQLFIPVTDGLMSASEYCIILPSEVKTSDGKVLADNVLYAVSRPFEGDTQEVVIVNETFDDYNGGSGNINVPQNWWNRNQSNLNYVKLHSDSEHDKAMWVGRNYGATAASCISRNFGRVLDSDFTIEFDFNPLYFNNFIAGEAPQELIDGITYSIKDKYNWHTSNPSFTSDRANMNMEFSLAPVPEDGQSRKDLNGRVLNPQSWEDQVLPDADVRYVSNDKLKTAETFFVLYGDRLGFAPSGAIPEDGNYVRVEAGNWYNVKLYIEPDSSLVTGYINGIEVGPYTLTDFNDAQYGAVAARAQFFISSGVAYNMQNNKAEWVDENGEQQVYNKRLNSQFAIDNFKVSYTAPSFKVSQMRFLSADGKEFAPRTTTVGAVNRATFSFTSEPQMDSIVPENIVITDEDGTSYDFAVTDYDEVNSCVTIEFDKILKANMDYTVSASGVVSKNGSIMIPYEAEISVGNTGELLIDKATTISETGTEITGGVTNGMMAFLNTRVVNGTSGNKAINVFVAGYLSTENGEKITDITSQSFVVSSGESKVISDVKNPVVVCFNQNADYIKAFADNCDDYSVVDKFIGVDVTEKTVTISGTAQPYETVKIDIPVSLSEYASNKSGAMVYRDIIDADENGKFTVKISAEAMSKGEYTAYVYYNTTKTFAKNDFAYALNSDVNTAIGVLNSTAEGDLANVLGQNWVNLRINASLRKSGSDEKAAVILKKYGALPENDPKKASEILNEIYAVTAIDNGNIENLFDYADVLGLDESKISDFYEKDYVTEEVRKKITNAIKGGNYKSLADFENELTEKFVLTVIGAEYAPAVTEEIVNAFALEIGVDISSLSSSNYRNVSGKDYADYKALKTALTKSSNSGGGSSSGGGGGGGSSSGGGSKPSDIKIPTENESVKEKPIPIDIFTDIENVSWAKSAIVYLAEQGILDGTSQTTFSPNNKIKREEMAKILVNAFTKDEKTGINPFADANENAWYYQYVIRAYYAGIVNGYDNNMFGVGDPITRQDMAVMIYNAAVKAELIVEEKEEIETQEKEPTQDDLAVVNDKKHKEVILFGDDNEIADYAKKAVYALRDAKVINGVDTVNFAPKATATRAEAAKIIYGLLRF